MNKLERDNKIAVIYSPGYGSGWFTSNTNYPECVFDPNIVNMIENKNFDQIPPYSITTFGEDFFPGNVHQLTIKWLPKNTQFRICEYDGNEYIQTPDDINWMTT